MTQLEPNSELNEKTTIKLFPMASAVVAICGFVISLTAYILGIASAAQEAKAYNAKQDIEIKEKNIEQDAEIKELKRIANSTEKNLIEINATLRAVLKERR